MLTYPSVSFKQMPTLVLNTVCT